MAYVSWQEKKLNMPKNLGTSYSHFLEITSYHSNSVIREQGKMAATCKWVTFNQSHFKVLTLGSTKVICFSRLQAIISLG